MLGLQVSTTPASRDAEGGPGAPAWEASTNTSSVSQHSFLLLNYVLFICLGERCVSVCECLRTELSHPELRRSHQLSFISALAADVFVLTVVFCLFQAAVLESSVSFQ